MVVHDEARLAADAHRVMADLESTFARFLASSSLTERDLSLASAWVNKDPVAQRALEDIRRSVDGDLRDRTAPLPKLRSLTTSTLVFARGLRA